MRFKLVKWLAVLTAIVVGGTAMAYEEAFSKTPVEEIIVRELPPARWLTTTTDGHYFEQNNRLFMRLFDFIKANDIAMTVPVEGTLQGATMRFYLGRDVTDALDPSEEVDVVTVPARRVVSIGGRGAYSEENIEEARASLTQWLRSQNDWVASGAPYAVFWNGPFTPWFMKRFEVHQPVVRPSDG